MDIWCTRVGLSLECPSVAVLNATTSNICINATVPSSPTSVRGAQGRIYRPRKPTHTLLSRSTYNTATVRSLDAPKKVSLELVRVVSLVKPVDRCRPSRRHRRRRRRYRRTTGCLLYTSPSPRDRQKSRMPSSA